MHRRRTSSSAASYPLLLPIHRETLLQPIEDDALVQHPGQDRLDDVRRQQRQQRQPSDPADVAGAQLLGGGDLDERRVDAAIKLSIPLPGAGQCLNERAVRLGAGRRGEVAAVGGRGCACGRPGA